MVFYTQWIHSHNQSGFNQNVGVVLQDRTPSCFVIDFVMLIFMMCWFNLVDTTLSDLFLRMRVGRRGHYSYYPCDVCFMIFLRRMAYPSRYGDLVNDYNILSMRIFEIFHATLSWVYSKTEQVCLSFNLFAIVGTSSSCLGFTASMPIVQPVRYCGYFQLFADALTSFGSPFPNPIPTF